MTYLMSAPIINRGLLKPFSKNTVDYVECEKCGNWHADGGPCPEASLMERIGNAERDPTDP